MADSRRINANIREEDEKRPADEQPPFGVYAVILSSEFWPPFKDEKLEVPEDIREALDVYCKKYEKLKVLPPPCGTAALLGLSPAVPRQLRGSRLWPPWRPAGSPRWDGGSICTLLSRHVRVSLCHLCCSHGPAPLGFLFHCPPSGLPEPGPGEWHLPQGVGLRLLWARAQELPLGSLQVALEAFDLCDATPPCPG